MSAPSVPPPASIGGPVPVAVVMIALNEAHNMEAVLQNLARWAQQVFLVDSFSADDTVDIALRHGVYVVQRRFRGFGDQWNFALRELPITAPWTMKLDPDERLTEALKQEIARVLSGTDADGLTVKRRLWFMGRRLPIQQTILRLWRTGRCRFSEVLVNEHPLVEGRTRHLRGELAHHDSPDLHHWCDKQNRYSTAEAASLYCGSRLSATPRLLGNALERRMWLKTRFQQVPFRFLAIFVYYYVVAGLWRAGWVGYVWSKLRSDVYRMTHYKLCEMRLTRHAPSLVFTTTGRPDRRVPQHD